MLMNKVILRITFFLGIILMLVFIKLNFPQDYVTVSLTKCSCEREIIKLEEDNSVKLSETTCGRDAFSRGSNQKVASFSFYGNTSTEEHKLKNYFAGIEENLRLLRYEE